jgi:fructosamine-3-kinase
VPGRLQHGDLWPANVLRRGDSWWLLDYELFGEVRVPLYDALHLLRTSDRIRRPRAETWVASLMDETAETAATRAILGRAAQRHGLTPAEVAAAFVYYVADGAARSWRRQAAADFWEPVLAEAETLADLEASGVNVAAMLLGDSAAAGAPTSVTVAPVGA